MVGKQGKMSYKNDVQGNGIHTWFQRGQEVKRGNKQCKNKPKKRNKGKDREDQ